MEATTTGAQFVIGCLTFGLGLFLLAGTLRGLSGLQLFLAISVRATTALSGAALLAVGGLVAILAVPL
jgi:hypothetical protein